MGKHAPKGRQRWQARFWLLIAIALVAVLAPTATPAQAQNAPADPQVLAGDVDCDELLTIVDAFFIAQYIVGMRDAAASCDDYLPTDGSLVVSRGDITGDGVVNIVDAFAIVLCLVGAPLDGVQCALAEPPEPEPENPYGIVAHVDLLATQQIGTVSVIANPGDLDPMLGAIVADVLFDPESYELVSCVGTSWLQCREMEPGIVRIVNLDPAGVVDGDELGAFELVALTDQPARYLVVEAAEAVALDGTILDPFEPDAPGPPDGYFRVGDVNCDDIASVADVLLIVQFLVNDRVSAESCDDFANDPSGSAMTSQGDASGDGAIDLIDPLVIIDCIVGVQFLNIECNLDMPIPQPPVVNEYGIVAEVEPLAFQTAAAVRVIANPGEALGGLTVDVQFDPTAYAFAGCDGQSIQCHQMEPGLVRLVDFELWGIDDGHELGVVQLGARSDQPRTFLAVETVEAVAVNGEVLKAFVPDAPAPAEGFFRVGDVNCDDAATLADAFLIAGFEAGVWATVGSCEELFANSPGTLVASRGDLDVDEQTNIVDSLLITRCLVDKPVRGFECDVDQTEPIAEP